MSDLSDSLIESGCIPQSNCCSGLFTLRYDSHSGVSHSAANEKLKFWMIYDVDSPLRIFVADCGHKGQCSSSSGDTAHQTGSGVTPECSLIQSGGHKNRTYAETGFLQFKEPGSFKKR